MKRFLCCLLGIALLLSLFAGCGGDGEPMSIVEGGANELSKYLSGKNREEFMLRESTEIDITAVKISKDRTIHLMEDVTLKIYGEMTPGKSAITVRAENEGGKKPVLDLSGLSLADVELREATLFEIRSDIELVPPAESETLVVDTSNEQWTSLKSIPLREDEPKDDGPQGDNVVSTSEEFFEVLDDPEVGMIELDKDITIEFEDTSLTRDLFIICNGHALTLSGRLNMHGGTLDIRDNEGVEGGTVDLSGLTVTCDVTEYTSDLIFIGLNFKQIIGEATLGEGMHYEIPDSGEHTSIRMEEVITPEMHEEKLAEEMTQYLSGVEFSGGVGMSAEFLADGVLEINLDNPVIDHEIGVGIDGGLTLILTGSVTFDGGMYGFEMHDGSTGTATVDITGLEIHGTAALGSTKSPDIFKITGADIDFLYNQNDRHIKVEQGVGGDWFYLRYVQ